MTTQLTIVVRIEARPDRRDFVEAELRKLVSPTRAEAGCRQYDLHRDNDDPNVFVFYETWETKPLWEAHMQSAHIAAFRDAIEGALVSRTLNEMSLIE